ncbi:MAG: ATP-binding protein [Cyanobacteria bacterium J06600_6]
MSSQEYTILIIDDSAEDREMYRRFLARELIASYQIIEAESGQEALEQLTSVQPDLILLDYLLPDCNGLEFLEELELQVQQMPLIVMLTGQGNEVVAVEAMKSGVKDYLVKGQLTAKILNSSVTNILQQNRLKLLLQKSFQQQRLIAETALRIRKSFNLSEILNTAVREVQLLLDCDRVVIYRFAPDLSGDILAESINPGWTKSLGQNIVDTCFRNRGAVRYEKGKNLAVNDIHQAGLSSCHIELLEQFEVKAHIVCPLLLAPSPSSPESTLWGLLIAHQCSGTRIWQQDEIDLLDKLAVQMAIAIQQSELVSSIRTELSIRKQAENSLKEKAQELELTNQKLLKATSLLTKQNKELDRFAYVTSHDLKAPLRAIANLAVWLSEDLDGQIPAESQRQLQLMQSRVERMEGLIQGLLNYSRVGKKNIPKTVVNTSSLVQEAITLLSLPSDFEIILPAELPTFKTKAILLQQVFSNLIDNAIKYHPHSHGKVIISVAEQNHFYQFGVADNGLGIDPQYHERIFTIFQTLQARDTFESTGIGLSIVKKIVEGQGGKIWVESALEEGATFYFTWPK